MRKKLITSVVCLALLLIMFIGSSIAYFSDTVYHANTMVAGKISITQTVVDTQVVVMPTLDIDRTITVANDGNQPCYVRTLIAFEDAPVGDTGKTMLDYLNFDRQNIIVPTGADKITITVDGVNYTVAYYVHRNQLDANASYTCLNTIELDASAPSEWEVAAGTEYKILVLSQATQVTGLSDRGPASALDYVFGFVKDNAEDWFVALQN